MISLIPLNCDEFAKRVQKSFVNSHVCVKCSIRECQYNYLFGEYKKELEIRGLLTTTKNDSNLRYRR